MQASHARTIHGRLACNALQNSTPVRHGSCQSVSTRCDCPRAGGEGPATKQVTRGRRSIRHPYDLYRNLARQQHPSRERSILIAPLDAKNTERCIGSCIPIR